jgi:hypothetical protein
MRKAPVLAMLPNRPVLDVQAWIYFCDAQLLQRFGFDDVSKSP